MGSPSFAYVNPLAPPICTRTVLSLWIPWHLYWHCNYLYCESCFQTVLFHPSVCLYLVPSIRCFMVHLEIRNYRFPYLIVPFKTCFAVLDPSHFHINFTVFSPFFWQYWGFICILELQFLLKSLLSFYWYCSESMDWWRENCHLSIESFNSWT